MYHCMGNDGKQCFELPYIVYISYKLLFGYKYNALQG